MVVIVTDAYNDAAAALSWDDGVAARAIPFRLERLTLAEVIANTRELPDGCRVIAVWGDHVKAKFRIEGNCAVLLGIWAKL